MHRMVIPIATLTAVLAVLIVTARTLDPDWYLSRQAVAWCKYGAEWAAWRLRRVEASGG